MKFARSIRPALLGAAAVTALGFFAAPAAQAHTGYENQMSPEACNSHVSSGFKFTLWYNSSYAGAHRNIGYSVWDLGHESIGGSSAGQQPLYFCESGTKLKNNAASAQNRHVGNKARVHFNSGYAGPVDTLGSFSSMFKLKNTYNNNASFSWAL
ncbi:hypothetical protein [Kitasatospora sp. NPDC094011]|uniref:hypothetical protein n=1 Tax=Kitasatospora sp. NPDC094011 TaxID=3364090 RepID=UPI0037F77112